MDVHLVVHRRPDASLTENLANLRAAPERLLGVKRHVTFVLARFDFASMVATTPHWPWVTEREAKARRVRNLIEDNPASG